MKRITSTLSWAEAGPRLAGKAELVKFLRGGRITRNQAIKAACYRCSSCYDTGKFCAVSDCPLLPYSPFARSAKNQKLNGAEEALS